MPKNKVKRLIFFHISKRGFKTQFTLGLKDDITFRLIIFNDHGDTRSWDSSVEFEIGTYFYIEG